MRKVIAGINVTIDGFCDHTAVNPDEEIHQHYTELLRNADTILYGRITYQLMEFWPPLVQNPSGNKALDEFAVVMDNIEKVVFSRTLKSIDWKTARLATRDLKEEVLALRQQAGTDILVGSRSLIIALMNLGLIDELQLMLHPITAGKGLPLFKDVKEKIAMNLVKTKTFKSGAITLYYKPVKVA